MVIQLTLDKLGHMPQRTSSDISDFEKFFSETDILIIDATEQRKQRHIHKIEQ